ncbi:serine/threonine-protein kinase [Bifidobacterium aerophilum]|uniref:non-specific serine/threonine protein kinase n=1 Tax=Bifidobacterium aerophilum TaxID=1798155 RepID=A0A6N9Z6T0_9BIFI|nr:serine/threonine-protein kinase [Bifidobacterium aerophilum]NEG90419.1 protein kinase [Bifidobacterium aerophilum]
MVGMNDVSALSLKPGDLIGGYTLVSRLGAGAMGSVWRARDDGGQEYAMKILRDSLADDTVPNVTDGGAADGTAPSADGRARAADDPELRERLTARERLRREAMALKKVNHPGVCGIVDMELDDSVAFIVTELIEGKNLREDVRANGRYTGDDLERLARKLIAAVKAVHAAGIVHRDIKPTNVMVSASGPVLVDFGIAMTGGESHVTRTGLVMGTPGFIAPEIIDGAESDEMTDWWSTASVLAFAATGSPVFGTKPMMAVLERAAAGSANLTGLPAGTMAAFRSALNPDRSKRCTPDQLLQAITLDALNPAAWQDAQAEPAAPTEVVRPFDQAAADNPRLLWRLEPAPEANMTPDTTQTPTTVVDTAAEPATRVIRSDSPEATSALPAVPETQPAPPRIIASNGPETTAVMPADTQRQAVRRLSGFGPDITADPAATTVMNSPDITDSPEATAVIAGNPIADPTQVSPIPPLPPAVEPQAGSVPPFLQEVAAAQPTPPPPVLPGDQPFPQPYVNPADVRRGQYWSHGMLPLWLLTVPVAVIAASVPAASVITAALLLWLLMTVGYSAESQLEREARRGGERKGTDGLINAASLPWHLLKALGATAMRMLPFVAAAIAVPAVSMAVLGLPVIHIGLPVASWTITVPLLSDVPVSASGLALGGGAAIGWLLAVFASKNASLRLGCGALRGYDPQSSGSRRDTLLLLVWIALTAGAVVALLTGTAIDWWPLS